MLAIAAGQAVPPDVLIDALWDTASPAAPRGSAGGLDEPAAFGPGADRIEHRDHGYLLHCDWLDATELATLTRKVETRRETGHVMGAVAAARVALSLIRGDGPQPLPGECGPAQARRARAAGQPHLGGSALPDWLRFLRREDVSVTVVATVRSGEGEPLPATASIHLDALGRDAAAELVGPGRVDELYARSKGHPLFLTELAQQAAGAELPASLVESVSARCDEVGKAGLPPRTAAVIGPEVERRQVPRFAGRAVNFAGWVLRNLGAWTEALDHHHEALEVGQRQGTADVSIAALEDLAEQCLDTGDAAGAEARLAQAGALLRRRPGFGWRLELKHQFISARLSLLRGDAERALAGADDLAARAAALGVPRYTSVARLLAHRANRALGVPVDPGAVAADLDLLDRCVAIEAWRWTCDVATDFAEPAWLDRAADGAARLARGARQPCGRSAAGGGPAAGPPGGRRLSPLS